MLLMKATLTIGLDPWTMEVADVVRSTQLNNEESIGERLARLRRERGITQAELAQKLDLAQPNISDYERGILRLNADLILKIAQILKVSSDELLGLRQPKPGRAPRDHKLTRRLQEIERLPRRDQEALLRTIDAFLSKSG